MENDRFKNYINEIESEITCKAFLEENKEILNQIKKSMKYDREIKIYKALGHKLRYRIVKILEKKPMCVCALAQIFEKSDSSIAYHLNELQKAGLIIGKKEGYFTIYYTKEKLLNELSDVAQ
ncbi:MAG: metalloregulator ArsR/SmtB family transcription factor [Candidatus Lokiarchaeota archaeon]|nr:metalloregulator ArsR/SmtB family transcription factor [Candidatus Lokiarchaeota archaeon]MBD3200696.1 metalloregulator ArsR/SmtB family transcription factor [Candidatus Lokiarchaeota archaeon]